MATSLITRYGTLIRRDDVSGGMEEWAVFVAGREVRAVVYPALVGRMQPGDRVLLNTTAMELGLGTGGRHFVLARADLGCPLPPVRISREDGHILKMRYTPLQCRVLSAEEEASPHHAALCDAETLPDTPVVCLGLHSQLAPAAGGVKAAAPAARVAFLMTDTAALPLAFSRLVARMQAAGLVDATISAGQAFGGDLEAVNLYSGLLVAALAARADVIIAGPGPGHVGTGTPLGFGGVEQAQLINAAAALGGIPLAVPRLSFADPRERHRGLSHHTRTVLGRLALATAIVPWPRLSPAQAAEIDAQWNAAGLDRHTRIVLDGAPGIACCRAHGIDPRSMGREYDEDPAFFLAAAAGGRAAGEMRDQTRTDVNGARP